MLRSGTLPRNISDNTKEKLLAKIRHGGKSIEELTNYCKKLSKAEDLGELSFSDSDNDGDGKPRAFHHPFEVKDRGPIVMNIRVSNMKNSKQNCHELKSIVRFRIPFQYRPNKQASSRQSCLSFLFHLENSIKKLRTLGCQLQRRPKLQQQPSRLWQPSLNQL